MENQGNDQAALVRELSIPIYQSKGWLKLLGIVSIIQGIITVFTIIGILIAWLPIWIGVLLYKCASTVEHAYLTGDKVTYMESLGKLKTYFIIQGIMTLIGIIIAVIALSMGLLGAFFSYIS
jgi:hypothetical protein